MNIKENQEFEDFKFSGIRNESDITNKRFYNCNFIDCDFTNSDFSGSLFSECVFTNTNFSLIKLLDTKMHEVIFNGSKIMGIDFTQISKFIVELGFHESRISKCNFSALDLTETDFTDCHINQSDFYNTILTSSNFSRSDLKDTIFENTDLRKTDFSSAQNYVINPLMNKIKDAIFTMPEAIRLLDTFEIKIN